MKAYHKKDEYVYMDLHIRMSTKVMADVLYAGLITGAEFTTLWTMSREFSRKQNTGNGASIKVHIHPDLIPKFEELSGRKLCLPQKVNIN